MTCTQHNDTYTHRRAKTHPITQNNIHTMPHIHTQWHTNAHNAQKQKHNDPNVDKYLETNTQHTPLRKNCSLN